VAYFGLRADGQMDMVDFESKLNSNTRLVAVSMASNVLGAVNPIGDICNLCQKTIIQTTTTTTTQKNAIQKKPLVMVDATQFVPHFRLDVREIDCDFLVFSGHKIYAPTGVGVLFGKSKLLDQIPNYRVGGEMVDSVSMEGNIYKETPHRLEAGTSNFAGIIGLGTALEWFVSNESQVLETEKTLFEYLLKSLDSVEDLEIYGSKTFIDDSIPLVSFNIKGVNALDLALMLDFEGICVRSGQHCTGLLHEFLGLPSSCRISLSCYNTKEEIDFIIQKIQEIAIKLKSKK
jgi:selenocysteine lyase/cysteine desulfurase